ncbi:MAG: IS110 family transposase [Chloroflexota bacterium]|nr:IS110 family transposase [Chloroflexota bacterium]
MYIGVDTHKATHTLVSLDEQGRQHKTFQVANTPEDWSEALRWAREFQGDCIWGIENSGSLGKGFAQFLLSQGEESVHEVSPRRTAQYRRRGRKQDKTDQADALAIARLLIAEAQTLPVVQGDDLSTEMRILSDHRDNLLSERTRLINQLHAQMLQIAPSYQHKSGSLTKKEGILYCQGLELPSSDSLLGTRLLIVRQLCGQILGLDDEIAEVKKAIQQKVQQSNTALVEMSGIGEIVAARLIGELGSVPRISSAAALASLAGIAPVEVSSGGHQGFRLNLGGNRKLNRAFHIIALVQLRCNVLAKEYYARKRSEGKTGREALRCLKRQLVNVVYRLMRPSDAVPSVGGRPTVAVA